MHNAFHVILLCRRIQNFLPQSFHCDFQHSSFNTDSVTDFIRYKFIIDSNLQHSDTDMFPDTERRDKRCNL